MKKRQKRTTLRVKPGDCVLIGRPGITMPSDWFGAIVMWVGGPDILTEHTPAGGQCYRQVLDISHVRAVGSWEELRAYQRRCQELVDAEQKKVWETESALGRARDAVWAKLDEIAADVPGAAS